MYYIIGAGGFAKEVYFLASQGLDSSHNFAGFIDYEPLDNQIFIGGTPMPVISEDYFLKTISPSQNINLYIGIGNPSIIRTVANNFKTYNFPNLFHRDLSCHKDSLRIGRGNIIAAGCVFTVDISIGSFNIFNLNTTVGHDTIIKDFNVINPGCNISGEVNIGSGNLLGTNATVLQQISIGNHNILGACCLATKDITNNCTMVGVPAKKLAK